MVSASPCVLENGTGSSPPTAGGATANVAVAEDGSVWRAVGTSLRRISPLPSLKCAIGPGYVDEDDFPIYDVGPLFLDEGGKSGWGLDGPPGMLGRLTLGVDACSVELAVPPWGNLPVGPNTARDAQGRFHILDKLAGGLGIFTSTGTLVKKYSGKGSATDPAPFAVTACSGGLCILGADATGQSLLYLDDDGNPRAPALPLIKGLRLSHIAAARSGPVFIAGASDPVVEATNEVVIQLAPPPP
jgi:hypothetical protein